jgi:hypothetical protein
MASRRAPPAAAAAPAPYRLFVRQPDGPDDPGRENTLQALSAVKEMQDAARRYNMLLRVDVTRMAVAHLRDRRVQDSLKARGITELPALAHAGGVAFGAREIRRLFEGKIAAALADRKPAGRPSGRPPPARDGGSDEDPDEDLHDFFSQNLHPPSDSDGTDDDESMSKDLTKDKNFLRRVEEDRHRRAKRQEKSGKHAAELADEQTRRPAGGRERNRSRDDGRGRDHGRIGDDDDDDEDHDQRVDQAFSRRGGSDSRTRVDVGGDDLDRIIADISNEKIDVHKTGSGDGEGDDDLMARYLQNMEVSRL